MGFRRVSLQTRFKEKKEQNRAFVCSAAVHVIVFILVLGTMRATTTKKSPLIIDFSLEDRTESARSVQSPHSTEPGSRAAGIRRPIPATLAEIDVMPAKDIVIRDELRSYQEIGVRNQTASKEPPSSSFEVAGVATPKYGDGYGSGVPRSFSGQEDVTERPEMRYVKAHFDGIRNAIISRLTYPRLARRMGWTGTVKVSFIIKEDGAVYNVKVAMSSGFDVLDNNAVETIRRCSPYPRPPCRAEMVMPITYRLDD